MNIIRRHMLHPRNSRHNPLTRTALICILFAIATVALSAALELAELRTENAADKKMIAELSQFVEGDANLVEVVGEYAVEYSVQRKTYEAE